MYIRKGDNVIVIAGNDKGKKGKVLKAMPREDKVLIEGVNVLKRHRRASKGGKKGQIVDVTMPIHVSNVQLVDGKGEATRVGFKVAGDKKIRIGKTTGKEI